MARLRRFSLPFVVIVTVHCGQAPAPPSADAPAADLHPLVLADGRTTPNDQCPVRKRKLSAKIEPVWVNQQPIGFC